jgi:transposase
MKENVFKELIDCRPLCCLIDDPIDYLRNRGSERLEMFQSKVFVTARANANQATCSPAGREQLPRSHMAAG